MGTDIIIFIIVVVLLVIIVLINQKRSRTCPNCGQWRKTKTFKLDSTNMLLPDPVPGQKTVICVYKCQNCGNRWEEHDSESTS